MDANMEDQFEPIIKMETCDSNPWSVEDAAVFLKYCCPECEYNSEDLNVFSIHALENHERSTTLFEDKYNGNQMVPKTENDGFDSDEVDDKDNKVLQKLKKKFNKTPRKRSERHKALDHICTLCGENYQSIEGFKEHMLEKHPDSDLGAFVCGDCGFSTSSSKKLQVHKHAKHEVDKHKKCPHCDFKSPYNQKVKRHIDRQHPELGEKKFFCEQCGKGFIYNDSYKQHCAYECKHSNYERPKPKKPRKQKTAENSEVKCEICNIEITSLKAHNIEKHESDGQKICSYCGYKTKKLGDLKKHIDANHAEHAAKSHFCDQCEKGFIFRISLISHKSQHKREEKTKLLEHVCDQCGQKYKSLIGFKEHMLRKHPTNDATDFVCEICGHSAITESKLKQTSF